MAASDEPETDGEFEIRIAWRRDDPRLEADAIAMWKELGILPKEVRPEDRARQLVASAYRGGRLAALCTGVVERISFLRARFVVLRSLTHPDFRRSHAQAALTLPVKQLLEDWAAASPGEKIAGVIGFIEPGAWGEYARLPVAPIWAWTLVAYTEDGHQVRVVWFDDFRFDGGAPVQLLPTASPEALIPGLELRPTWRLRDPRIEADAIDFWRRLDILPADVRPEQRASELIAVVYKDDRIVGVHTAVVERLEQVRARLAMFRSAVDPDHRRGHVSSALTLYSRALLETWSRENPHERLAGIGTVVESQQLIEAAKTPYWPTSRLILAGFLPDGRQLRISWFEDFRLDLY